MAKRWDEVYCILHSDYAGTLWDLLLYVPTVGFLILTGMKFWYGGGDNEWLGYVLMFLGFFFLMVGTTRVMRRLLVTPSSPVDMDINKERIKFKLKNGKVLHLLKEIRYFPDHAGKSFGLTGVDEFGAKKQFIFHKKQFDVSVYPDVIKALERYK